MQLFRSRPFMITIVVFVIIGFVGAGAAALIPGGGGSGQPQSIDAEAVWASEPDDVKIEVCRQFRANPQGYLLLMEQTWLQEGILDQASFDELIDVIATDCRINY